VNKQELIQALKAFKLELEGFQTLKPGYTFNRAERSLTAIFLATTNKVHLNAIFKILLNLRDGGYERAGIITINTIEWLESE
jgi:hypothetical protein